LCDPDIRRGIGRGDQRQAIAQQILAAAVGDMAVLLQVIHPVGVGGEEDIGRSALFDLPRQGGRCAERQCHRYAGFDLIGIGHRLQAVGERRGGEDGWILGHGHAGLQAKHQGAGQQCADGQDHFHSLASPRFGCGRK
jgi:hypothetical protein